MDRLIIAPLARFGKGLTPRQLGLISAVFMVSAILAGLTLWGCKAWNGRAV